jgi:hypothetical protein
MPSSTTSGPAQATASGTPSGDRVTAAAGLDVREVPWCGDRSAPNSQTTTTSGVEMLRYGDTQSIVVWPRLTRARLATGACRAAQTPPEQTFVLSRALSELAARRAAPAARLPLRPRRSADASVDRSKPASCGRLKTGHHERATETVQFYLMPAASRKRPLLLRPF